jgi:hypothetical protein
MRVVRSAQPEAHQRERIRAHDAGLDVGRRPVTFIGRTALDRDEALVR